MERIGELVKVDETYLIRFNGKKLVSSKNREACTSRLALSKAAQKLGVTDYVDRTGEDGDSVEGASKFKQSEYEIGKRFEFMEQLTRLVVEKNTPSLIITGDSGTGKSHTVLDVIKASEMTEGVDYIVIKGFTTPKSMYRILYEFHNKLVIFDDCDSVLKDAVALNILKAALDSYDRRVIHYRTEKASDLPTNFEFTGQVIFISNYPAEKMNDALISRSILIDVSMSIEDRIERIRQILGDLGPENATIEQKTDVLDLMIEKQKEAFDFSLRTFLRGLKIRMHVDNNWKELASYMITR